MAGFVDPFAAVAAVLGPGSAGWTPTVEWSSYRGSKRPLIVLLLAGPIANVIAGAALLVGATAWAGSTLTSSYVGLYGSRGALGDFVDLAQVNPAISDGSKVLTLSYLQHALFLIGFLQLIVAAVSLIPLPPLEGGRLLFLFTPRSPGWHKAEYHLAERNIGLILVLVGLIRISSSITPPFAFLADVIAHGLAVLFTGT